MMDGAYCITAAVRKIPEKEKEDACAGAYPEDIPPAQSGGQ
jgi:hypothetical protein